MPLPKTHPDHRSPLDDDHGVCRPLESRTRLSRLDTTERRLRSPLDPIEQEAILLSSCTTINRQGASPYRTPDQFLRILDQRQPCAGPDEERLGALPHNAASSTDFALSRHKRLPPQRVPSIYSTNRNRRLTLCPPAFATWQGCRTMPAILALFKS